MVTCNKVPLHQTSTLPFLFCSCEACWDGNPGVSRSRWNCVCHTLTAKAWWTRLYHRLYSSAHTDVSSLTMQKPCDCFRATFKISTYFHGGCIAQQLVKNVQFMIKENTDCVRCQRPTYCCRWVAALSDSRVSSTSLTERCVPSAGCNALWVPQEGSVGYQKEGGFTTSGQWIESVSLEVCNTIIHINII